MKNLIWDRSIVLTVIFVLTGFLGSSAAGQSRDSGNVKVDMTQVRLFGQTTVVPYSGASLSRRNDAVFATFSTSGLAPGTVVSLWWVFFNNPLACGTDGCSVPDLFVPAVNASLHSAGAAIVGMDGRFTIAGFRAAGDTSGGHILPGMPDPSPGLLDAKRAAIHLVVRSHGPALAGQALTDQLTLFNGGCPPNTCSNLQFAPFEP